jgi:hypothetical protein
MKNLPNEEAVFGAAGGSEQGVHLPRHEEIDQAWDAYCRLTRGPMGFVVYDPRRRR